MSTLVSEPTRGQPLPFSAWPYVVPPVAAGMAIVPVFRDMIAKSAQQKGEPIPAMSVREGLKRGLKAAPTVGLIVGSQMVFQNMLEKNFSTGEEESGVGATLGSAALIGFLSAPILAAFNGQSMGFSFFESLRRLSKKQCAAITMQEVSFLGGMSLGDRMAEALRPTLGESQWVDYGSAFAAGAMGSLAGHPADTALTRWQNGLPVQNLSQLMRGAIRKARAIGVFSVLYKWGKESLSAT